jgi:hypothetical protein
MDGCYRTRALPPPLSQREAVESTEACLHVELSKNRNSFFGGNDGVKVVVDACLRVRSSDSLAAGRVVEGGLLSRTSLRLETGVRLCARANEVDSYQIGRA